MRLTLALRVHFRYGRARGLKKTGKNREPYLIRSNERKEFVDSLLQECTNEMWLTRPYLSRDQERRLSTKFIQTSKGNPLHRTDPKSVFAHRNMAYRINMPQHVSFEQRWDHLKVSEKWKPFENHENKRVFFRYALAAIPSRYPDFYPPPAEKWNEWNKVEGFGMKKTDSSYIEEKQTRNTESKSNSKTEFNKWDYFKV